MASARLALLFFCFPSLNNIPLCFVFDFEFWIPGLSCISVMSTTASGATGIGLFCVDFVPDYFGPDANDDRPSKDSNGAFSKFPSVVNKANRYLQQNPSLYVKSCETVQYRIEDGCLRKPDKSDFKQLGESTDKFIKALRVWVTRSFNAAQKPEADQIRYLNFAPQFSPQGLPTPVTHSELFVSINEYLKREPLPGRIVAVESVQFNGLARKLFDPDLTHWDKDTKDNAINVSKTFILALRLWYIRGEPQHEAVKCVEFYPRLLRPANDNEKARFEELPTVLRNVEDWMSNLPSNSFIVNITTLNARAEADGLLSNPHLTFQIDEEHHKFYVKFFRVVYVEKTQLVADPPGYRGPHLNCKLFAPEQIESGFLSSGTYETISTMKARLDEWVQRTSAKVIAVETVVCKAKSGGEYRDDEFNPMCMFTWHSEVYSSHYKRNCPTWEMYFLCFRLFLEDNGGK